MGLREWIVKKLTPKNPNQGVITEDMREQGLAVRRQEAALKQKEKQVEMMERILNIETKTNPKEDMMETLIKELLPSIIANMKNGGGAAAPQNFNYDNVYNQPVTPSSPVDVPPPTVNSTGATPSKEEIKKFIDGNPDLKQKAKRATDGQIEQYLKMSVPNVTDETVKNIILEVRA